MIGTGEPMARREPGDRPLKGLCAAPAGVGACCRSAATTTNWIADRAAHETAVGQVVMALRVAGTVAQTAGARSAAAASALLGMWRVRRVEHWSGLRYRHTSVTPPSQRVEVGLRRMWV